MAMSARRREPRGIPSGGRFASGGRPSSGVSIGGGALVLEPVPDLIDLSPAAESVLAAIRDAGGKPLIVGGSVRDAVMARLKGSPVASKDIDIEVYGLGGDELREALGRVGPVNEVGASFGVIVIALDGEKFDVSLPRRDSRAGEGHRGFDVEIDQRLSYEEAFARRDYTINSIGWDPASGDVIDPFNGIPDIEAGVLRHTSASFGDDADRVLRGVGFAGRFGFDIAPETAEVCRSLAERFHELPLERVREEWRKIAVLAPAPSKSLEALQQVGWEQHFPELAAIRDVPQDPRHHPEGPVHVHIGQAADQAASIAVRDALGDADREVLVMAAMLHDLGKASDTQLRDDGSITSHGHATSGEPLARAFLRRIGATAKLADQVAPIVREHMATTSIGGRAPSASDVRRLIRRLHDGGKGTTIEQWARVCEADRRGRGEASVPTDAWAWVQVSRSFPAERPVLKPIITGQHLIAAGLRPGPGFTPIMDAAIEAQDAGEIFDEESAAAWLARRLD